MSKLKSEYIIYSIEDLCEKIEIVKSELNKNSCDTVRHRTLWYRGQENADWQVIPSIQRNGNIVNEQFFHILFIIMQVKLLRTKCQKQNMINGFRLCSITVCQHVF